MNSVERIIFFIVADCNSSFLADLLFEFVSQFPANDETLLYPLHANAYDIITVLKMYMHVS